MDKTTVLVTGSNGMIGSKIAEMLLSQGCDVVGIDRTEARWEKQGYTHICADLGDAEALKRETVGYPISHIIHLAALAHKGGESDLSWERYLYINVTCAENVFRIAAERKLPILFSSTADVYGIADGVVDGGSERHPIGNYAKSKCLAEDALREICKDTPYTIMRFAPVYTSEIKRDIQKRYYLKYPNIAYRVGRGVEYEVLSIEKLMATVADWVSASEGTRTVNVKDDALMNTPEKIREEKQAGRAKLVLWVPRWCVALAFRLARAVAPTAWKTYMLNKVVNPLRTR